ncbi:hypothetical protein PRK78_007132 [Emydomyces testavorans]|uniref:Homeobox domain-containing protein n=1 Tax=Emydomyces testavorans TaxID=2070801 RepID=A0AAF0DQU8_9EURO|nr:hypothetical protein PRK78_007132 [Emydomyces testavorans]
MEYVNNPFPFGDHIVGPFDPPLGYGVSSSFAQCNPPADPYFIAYPSNELSAYPGFYSHAGPFEDYDEYVENLSRPRLTKEQVETLEAQFQAHPKPNSNVKRQLAVQTNLTLPRVANWFQNRRAKAKQQKRQEEYEKMQAMKTSVKKKDEDCSSSVDSDLSSSRKNEKQNEETTPKPAQEQVVLMQQSDTPYPMPFETQSNASHSIPKADVTSSPHHDFDSRVKAVVDKTKMTRKLVEDDGFQVQQVDKLLENNNNDLPTVPESAPPTWELSTYPNHAFNTKTIGTRHRPSSEALIAFDSPELWSRESSIIEQPLLRVSYSTCDARSPLPDSSLYSNIQPFLPTEASNFGAPGMSLQRREPCSSEQMEFPNLSNHHEIMSAAEQPPEKGFQDPQIAPQINKTFPRHRDKKPDLAARRKRPRPAAIGIGGPSRSLIGPSSMSPTTRAPTWGISHSLRHAKSSQNLGSGLSPRYAGVRKISAPLRSPLGIAASSELTEASCSNADFTVPPLVTTSMAPPTPLTPDDLQYLLPPTPNDAHYCLSPTDEMQFSRLFPASHSLDGHSPPRTPHHPDTLSQLQYHSSRPQIAPSAISTAYETYSLPATHGSILTGLWAEGSLVPGSISVPEVHMSKPTHISPITQHNHLGRTNIAAEESWSSFSPPQHHMKRSDSPLSQNTSAPLAREITAEFMIEEFPNQQEAHRLAAQQLSSEKPKSYMFTNRTPNDF